MQLHKQTTCPEFDEDFVFDVAADDVCERTLEVLMYDAAPPSPGRDTAADECTGQIILPLEDVNLTAAETIWLCKGVTSYVKKNEVWTSLQSVDFCWNSTAMPQWRSQEFATGGV